MKNKFLSMIKNVRFLIFLIFVVSFFLMSYGYATFHTDEHLYGLGSISKYGKVYISNIQMISAEFVNATGSIQEYSDTSATLPVAASDTIFSATYLVTITNSMVIDQVLAGVTVDPQVTSGSATVDNYVEMTDYATGNKVYPGLTLSAQSDTVLKVKIYYTSDDVTTISTDFGIIVIDDPGSGTLSKGTIDRTTGSFDDNKTPECYTVSFMNSYSYDAVVGITTTTGYDILNTNGGAFGNVTIPANSTQSVTYCIKPTITMTNTSVTLPITYQSYNTGQTFSDNIVISMTTNHRTFTIATNFEDGRIICNNLTTGQYSIIYSTGSGSHDVMVGDEIECSVGDQNDLASNADYQYVDSSGNVSDYYYEDWTVTSESSTYNKNITLTAITTIAYNHNHTGGHSWGQYAVSGTYTTLHNGYYMIELYGADGGDGYQGQGGDQGDYGYVYGAVNLNAGTVLYYSLGGKGEAGHSNSGSNTRGGGNGGGRSEEGHSFQGGAGGGYSILQLTNSSGTTLMIAGGGGGGAGPGGSWGAYIGGDGGDGGRLGVNATTSISTGLVIHGSDGITPSSRGDDHKYGTGGTTTGGYNINNISGDYAKTVGSSLTGGEGAYRGGGGGAGYMGGGGGIQSGAVSRTSSGAGGGGSSFISSSVNYTSSKVTSSFTNDNPGALEVDEESTGTHIRYGGGIKITYLGSSL